MAKPITKYAVQIRNPEDIVEELNKAYHIATTGRRGPVLIDLPMNIQRSEVENPVYDMTFEDQTYRCSCSTAGGRYDSGSTGTGKTSGDHAGPWRGQQLQPAETDPLCTEETDSDHHQRSGEISSGIRPSAEFRVHRAVPMDTVMQI